MNLDQVTVNFIFNFVVICHVIYNDIGSGGRNIIGVDENAAENIGNNNVNGNNNNSNNNIIDVLNVIHGVNQSNAHDNNGGNDQISFIE